LLEYAGRMAEKKSFGEWLKHWLIDHLSFAALEHGAKLLFKYWTVPTVSGVAGGLVGLIAWVKSVHSPVLIGLVVFILGITTWKTWAIRKQILHRVEFNYIPGSPLENDWTKAYRPEGKAIFSTDPDIPGSLRMKVSIDEFAMWQMVPAHAVLATHMEFTAKFVNSADIKIMTMVFTELEVASKDGSQRKRVWFKYYNGDRPPKETPFDQVLQPNWLPEQTVYLPARISDRGRMKFDIDFPEVVKLALGDEGWVYSSVQRVQLRGSISISPLVFSTITPRF